PAAAWPETALLRRRLETDAQRQVDGVVAAAVEADGKQRRPQRTVEADEHAAVLAGAAQADVAASLPHIAQLGRNAGIQRQHIEQAFARTADAPEIDQPCQAQVRPDQCIARQTGEVEETTGREETALVDKTRVEQRAGRYPAHHRVAVPG